MIPLPKDPAKEIVEHLTFALEALEEKPTVNVAVMVTTQEAKAGLLEALLANQRVELRSILLGSAYELWTKEAMVERDTTGRTLPSVAILVAR